jgi:hypothetical protein
MTLNLSASLGSFSFEFPAAFSYGGEYDALLRLIALSTKEPKRQSARVVIWCTPHRRTTNAQRALFAGLSPPATLHDHSHQNANRLPQTLVTLGLNRAQKLVDARQRFEFPHDAGHGGAVMMSLGFLHTPLASRVVEEFEHLVKRLAGIIQDIDKRSSLPIFQKVLTRDSNFDHDLLTDFTEYENGSATTAIASTNIVAPKNVFGNGD